MVPRCHAECPVTPEKLGSLIGAVFGLVFVLVNTDSLPPTVALLLRVLAVAAFVAVLLAVRRPAPPGRPPVSEMPSPGGGFSRGYWLIVAAEVLAIWLGLAVLNGRMAMPEAAVAWVSLVVGAHFFALAVLWKQPLFHWLGAALLACGAAGLALAFADAAPAAIDGIGGVLPGATLLGFALWGSTRASRSRPLPLRAG